MKVSGKPIIEHIIRNVEQIESVGRIYVVTNAKFNQHFKEWLRNFDANKPIEIINDGTTSNEDRLGALGNIHFLINEKNLADDFIVVAGDNLFELNLTEVCNYFRKRKSNVIVLHDVRDLDLAKQYGIVEVDNNNLVINFVEKPISPKSTLASTGIYLFPKKTIELIRKYVAQGNNPDKTGNFIEWLHKREKVHSYITDKRWYDIGSMEQLEEANRHYKASL